MSRRFEYEFCENQEEILSCFETQLATNQLVLHQETQRWHVVGLKG
jgi:hypothetical protein